MPSRHSTRDLLGIIKRRNAGLHYPHEAGIGSPDLLASPEPGHKQNLNN